MKSKLLLAVAAFATIAAGAVRADEADGSQHVLNFQGNRTRAEVQDEAGRVAANRSTEPAGSRVGAPMKSTIDTTTLREETRLALRRGQISYGEAGRS